MDTFLPNLGNLFKEEKEAEESDSEVVEEDETKEESGAAIGGSEVVAPSESARIHEYSSPLFAEPKCADGTGFAHTYSSLSFDPIDTFTGGAIGNSSLESTPIHQDSSESSGSSANNSDIRTHVHPPSQDLLARRESNVSTSSESSVASLGDSRAGVVMAEHLDTFSGAFNHENYQVASTYVGRRRGQPDGILSRVAGYVSRFGDSSDGPNESLASRDVQSEGQVTAQGSLTEEKRGAILPAELQALKNKNSPNSTPSSSVSSSSSSGRSEPAIEEEFRVFGTNIDNPHLSSHPASKLPADGKAIGIIGRDFDEPQAVAKQLAHGLKMDEAPWNLIYFQPMVIPSKDLHKTDCRQYLEQGRFHLLIMCYNSTETRLMLTSPTGGYYKHVLPYAQHAYGKSIRLMCVSLLTLFLFFFINLSTCIVICMNAQQETLVPQVEFFIATAEHFCHVGARLAGVFWTDTLNYCATYVVVTRTKHFAQQSFICWVITFTEAAMQVGTFSFV